MMDHHKLHCYLSVTQVLVQALTLVRFFAYTLQFFDYGISDVGNF